MTSYVELTGVVERHTDGAVKFEVDGERHWIPKSVIDWSYLNELQLEHAMDEGKPLTILVQEWLARDRGLA